MKSGFISLVNCFMFVSLSNLKFTVVAQALVSSKPEVASSQKRAVVELVTETMIFLDFECFLVAHVR